MQKYMVRVEYGKDLPLGSHTSVGMGTFHSFKAAQNCLWQIVNNPMVGVGFRTVTIAAQNPDGTYNKGPYGLNAVYQVTETK